MDVPLEENHSILGPLTVCHTHPWGFNTAAVIRSRKATVGFEVIFVMVSVIEQHAQQMFRDTLS